MSRDRGKRRRVEDEELMPRALPVAEQLPAEDRPPATGAEYLRLVREEVRKCPSVVVAKRAPTKQANLNQEVLSIFNRRADATAKDLLPDPDWEKGFLVDFAEQRQAMVRYLARRKAQADNHGGSMATENNEQSSQKPALPGIGDRRGWKLYCLGYYDKEPSSSLSAAAAASAAAALSSPLSVLSSALSSSSSSSKVESSSVAGSSKEESIQTEALSSSISPLLPTSASSPIISDASGKQGASSLTSSIEGAPLDNAQGHPPSLLAVGELDQHRCMRLLEMHDYWLHSDGVSLPQTQWIYALLIRIDKLLTSDHVSVLRSICKKMISFRNQMKPDDPMLPSVNIIITVVSKYFEQCDLAA